MLESRPSPLGRGLSLCGISVVMTFRILEGNNMYVAIEGNAEIESYCTQVVCHCLTFTLMSYFCRRDRIKRA